MDIKAAALLYDCFHFLPPSGGNRYAAGKLDTDMRALGSPRRQRVVPTMRRGPVYSSGSGTQVSSASSDCPEAVHPTDSYPLPLNPPTLGVFMKGAAPHSNGPPV